MFINTRFQTLRMICQLCWNHNIWVVVCCWVAKSCPNILWPRDYNPPGSSIHGISQARVVEWVATSFSRGSPWPRNRTHIPCIGRRILYHWASCAMVSHSHVRLFVIPWTVACQAALSMRFSRQEYRSGLPCPPPGNLPDPGIKSVFPAWAGGLFSIWPTKEAFYYV